MTENYLLVDASGNATEIKGETKIGRSKTNEVVLTDPLASRHHATVYYEGDILMIRDEESVNGTIVNRGQIYDPVALNDQDTIQFGDEVLSVRAPLTEAKTVRKPKQAEEAEEPKTKSAADVAAKPQTTAKKAPGQKAVAESSETQPPAPKKAADPAPQPPRSSPEPVAETPEKSSNKKIIIIAGVTLLVLCVCCIVVGVIVNSFGVFNSVGF